MPPHSSSPLRSRRALIARRRRAHRGPDRRWSRLRPRRHRPPRRARRPPRSPPRQRPALPQPNRDTDPDGVADAEPEPNSGGPLPARRHAAGRGRRAGGTRARRPGREPSGGAPGPQPDPGRHDHRGDGRGRHHALHRHLPVRRDRGHDRAGAERPLLQHRPVAGPPRPHRRVRRQPRRAGAFRERRHAVSERHRRHLAVVRSATARGPRRTTCTSTSRACATTWRANAGLAALAERVDDLRPPFAFADGGRAAGRTAARWRDRDVDERLLVLRLHLGRATGRPTCAATPASTSSRGERRSGGADISRRAARDPGDRLRRS